jgi:hypothetical protein
MLKRLSISVITSSDDIYNAQILEMGMCLFATHIDGIISKKSFYIYNKEITGNPIKLSEHSKILKNISDFYNHVAQSIDMDNYFTADNYIQCFGELTFNEKCFVYFENVHAAIEFWLMNENKIKHEDIIIVASNFNDVILPLLKKLPCHRQLIQKLETSPVVNPLLDFIDVEDCECPTFEQCVERYNLRYPTNRIIFNEHDSLAMQRASILSKMNLARIIHTKN